MTGRTIAGSPLFHFSPPPSIGRLANFQLPLELDPIRFPRVWEKIYSRDRVASPRNPKNNFGDRRRHTRAYVHTSYPYVCSYANTTWKRINRLERCREQPVSVFA